MKINEETKRARELIVVYSLFHFNGYTLRELSCRIALPKHMPQSPWSIVNMMTQPIGPSHSTSNTRIMKISTRAVWPHITTNCVTTWENRISLGDTPATQLRSRRPSILSTINADDVNATAKKKTMLLTDKNQNIETVSVSLRSILHARKDLIILKF